MIKNESKKIISLEIPESLREKLRKEAFKRDLSVSALIRSILEEKLSQKNAKKINLNLDSEK